jgi:hypothetical protein
LGFVPEVSREMLGRSVKARKTTQIWSPLTRVRISILWPNAGKRFARRRTVSIVIGTGDKHNSGENRKAASHIGDTALLYFIFCRRSEADRRLQ